MAMEQVSIPGAPGLPLPQSAPPSAGLRAPAVQKQTNPNPQPAVQEVEKKQPTPQQAQEAFDQKHLAQLSKVLDGVSNRLEFGVLENSGEMYVKIVDKNTNQVVRLQPAREFLEMKEKLATALGFLLDKQG